jgi:hypothetical protein
LGLSLFCAGVAPACAHLGTDSRRCDAVPPEKLAQLPQHLSETGLYDDAELAHVAPSREAYRPRFELWSDGADKRRWVALPEGQRIDTRDLDAWQFPEGTRFWKEFSVAGKRIETRLLQKIGPAPEDWVGAAYVWAPDGSDATLAPEGRVDVGGSAHDVPAAAQCFGCHGGARSRVLGFSAIQLSSTREAEGGVSLESLSARGALSHPPSHDVSLPGDVAAQQALGYLHANCSHCHNQRRPERSGARCFDPERAFDLSLRTDALASIQDTAAYRSTADGIVIPGDPEHSELYRRMESGSMFLRRMPPLATEELDQPALSNIAHWISELPLR